MTEEIAEQIDRLEIFAARLEHTADSIDAKLDRVLAVLALKRQAA